MVTMNQLLTTYAQDLPNQTLTEYPRPQLIRDSYLNLNGYWDFAISKEEHITSYDRHIKVPFSPESVLSGIYEIIYPDDYIFYHKTLTFEKGFIKDTTILHFGAVDQICDVWINDQRAGHHVGGFTPFSIDLTPFIQNEHLDIKLRVQDVSDTSYHLTGKQRLDHQGIWYTPQSGIWQTVWIESLPKIHIKDLTITPLFDDHKVHISVQLSEPADVKVKVYHQNVLLIETLLMNQQGDIKLDSFYPWTPENPELYDIEIEVENDVVRSYFGMRSFTMKLDQNKIMRFYLNNEPYFQSGVLDQGYYSDGLLTPPSDQAMIDDIIAMKKLGFNMLRKHIKIEPMRWYYHCDRLGMLVWQDMVSGSERKDIMFHGALGLMNIHLNDRWYRIFGRKNKEGRALYEKDLNTMLQELKNVVSIAVWVPFNEAWGQFDSKRITSIIRSIDSTRLIDHASGWADQGVGEFYSRHIYFKKIKFKKKNAKKRILALTEFGGYSLPLDGHRYQDGPAFGYKVFLEQPVFQEALIHLYEKEVFPAIDQGLSVLVYTQVTDVENEVNGFLTYDRKVCKVDRNVMVKLHQDLQERFVASLK